MQDTLGVVLVVLIVFGFFATIISILRSSPTTQDHDDRSPTRHTQTTVQYEKSSRYD